MLVNSFPFLQSSLRTHKTASDNLQASEKIGSIVFFSNNVKRLMLFLRNFPRRFVIMRALCTGCCVLSPLPAFFRLSF